MAVQTLVIENIVRGMNKVKAYAVELTKVDKAAAAAQREIPKANRAMSQTGTAATRGAQGTAVLLRSLGKLALAYGAIAVAQKSFQAGVGRVESERRIKFLAEGYGEAAELAEAASVAAKKFGQSQTQANKALATAYARLRPVGTSLADIESVYTGFNTAARVSGASASEASNAFTQLAQALGSGALRGDEFNSIAEQVPAILTAVSKETGVAQGKLRDYAAEGKITADVVIRALKRIEKDGADQLAAAMDGPAQATVDLQNATEELMVAVTREIVPQMADAFRELGKVIVALEGPIKYIGGLLSGLLSLIGSAVNQINSLGSAVFEPGQVSAKKDIEAGQTPLNIGGAYELFKGTGPGGTGLKELREEARLYAKLRGEEVRKVEVRMMQDRLKTMAGTGVVSVDLQKEAAMAKLRETLKPGVVDSGGGGGGGGGTDAAKKAAEEENRLALEQAEIRDRLTQSLERDLELKKAATPLDEELARINHNYADTLADISELLDENERAKLKSLATQIKELETAEATADAEQRRADEAKRAAEEAARAAEAAKGKVEKYRDQLSAELADTEGMIVQLAQSVEGAMAKAMSSAITGLIDGTKTAEEAFADMFKAIGQAFIQMATQMIAKALIMKALGVLMPGGGGGGWAPTGGWDSFGSVQFAEGGYVTGPTNALIGEGGEPEYVIPESRMGEAMARYSQGATGEQVLEGPASEQSSPAGGMGTPEIVVQGGVLNFDGSQYIKQDQAPALVMQGAALGEARALKRLRMSPGARRNVGI